MKKSFTIIAAAAAILTLAGCASTPSESKPQAEPEKTEIKEEVKEVSNNPLSIPNDVYTQMLESSVMAKGNNARIKKFLEKIRSGEMVYVACIGGSVTEGAGPANFKDGYAYQFSKALRETYSPDGALNVTFDGAGLSGTSSPVGLVRYQQDVLEVLKTSPDLLVIEFAVNDGAEPTKQRAFEQLIRNVLEAKPDAVVIALYSAATYPNTQVSMSMVANHYNIPQVSVQNAINNRQNSFADNQFYTDIVHPTKDGHTIMKDCLMNVLDIADKAEADEPFAVPSEYKKRRDFSNFKQIRGDDENVKITAGDFNGTDTQTQGIKKANNKGNFPINWYKKSGSGNSPFKMEVTCKNLLLVYKDYGSWSGVKSGKAEIYVDGVLKTTVDGFTGKGWNNCLETIVIDNDSAAKHTVEVKMAAGDEDKAFTIVALGYSK